jgi:hypothetical protein
MCRWLGPNHNRAVTKTNTLGSLPGGPPQDDPPFGFQSSPTSTATATCTHPSNVAAASAPHHFHLRDDDDASNNASGTLPTSHLPSWSADGTPSHLPRHSASGTASPLRHSPHPARVSTGNDDVSLQRDAPATSSFLTVRGGQRQQ